MAEDVKMGPDHCGCQKNVMRSNLTGQQIGKLTVLGPSDSGPHGASVPFPFGSAAVSAARSATRLPTP